MAGRCKGAAAGIGRFSTAASLTRSVRYIARLQNYPSLVFGCRQLGFAILFRARSSRWTLLGLCSCAARERQQVREGAGSAGVTAGGRSSPEGREGAALARRHIEGPEAVCSGGCLDQAVPKPRHRYKLLVLPGLSQVGNTAFAKSLCDPGFARLEINCASGAEPDL